MCQLSNVNGRSDHGCLRSTMSRCYRPLAEGLLTEEDWFSFRNLSRLNLLAILQKGIPLGGMVNFDTRSAWTLRVRMLGPVRPEGGTFWTSTFTGEMDPSRSRISDLFIQAFSGGNFSVPWLTGRMLCNTVHLAEVLCIDTICATPTPRNTLSYLRAGFLPTAGIWAAFRLRLNRELTRLPPFEAELNAEIALSHALAESDPHALRQLLPNAGNPRVPGALFPLTCGALLRSDVCYWSGELNRHDAHSATLFGHFEASLRTLGERRGI